MNFWENMKQTANERLEICKTCDQFDSELTKCKVCGCFMMVKTMIPRTRCPLDKWGAVKTNTPEQENK